MDIFPFFLKHFVKKCFAYKFSRYSLRRSEQDFKMFSMYFRYLTLPHFSNALQNLPKDALCHLLSFEFNDLPQQLLLHI